MLDLSRLQAHTVVGFCMYVCTSTADCRCVACRAARAAYERQRRSAPLGVVDAGPVRLHLQQLQTNGVGTRQLAQLGRCSRSLVVGILAGRLVTVRPTTAAALLGVSAILAHGAIIKGTRTWRFIDSLRRECYTKREIGWRLGCRSQRLQLHKRVRVSSALRVERLYGRIVVD